MSSFSKWLFAGLGWAVGGPIGAAIGFFIGTVDNKQEFIKNTANKIIPAKDAKVIDIKSEISRDQDERQSEAPQIQTNDNKEDGE